MNKIVVFNIQKYSIHDGGGIRTIIFFKGCPLDCPWCSNPESQNPNPELMRRESLCIQCSSASCYSCTNSPEECPTGALEIVGKEMSIEKIIQEVKKDIIFYDSTGGGVTLSGGEPLSQGEAAIELLKCIKALGIDTAIETCGFGSRDITSRMTKYLDRVLFDLKIMDEPKSKNIIHGDVKVIKDNFQIFTKSGIEVIPRLPLIPGFTMDGSNIEEIIDFVKPQGIREVHILPFHQYGSSKYKGLDKYYSLKNLQTPSDEEVNKIKALLMNSGFKVVIGGK